MLFQCCGDDRLPKLPRRLKGVLCLELIHLWHLHHTFSVTYDGTQRDQRKLEQAAHATAVLNISMAELEVTIWTISWAHRSCDHLHHLLLCVFGVVQQEDTVAASCVLSKRRLMHERPGWQAPSRLQMNVRPSAIVQAYG